MEAHKPRSANPIDREELLSRVDHDYELLRDLVHLFKRDLPLQMSALRSATRSGDLQAAEKASHTLKGMLLNLAALPAGKSAGELEKLARNGEKTALSNALSLLETEVALLIPQLEAYLVNAEA